MDALNGRSLNGGKSTNQVLITFALFVGVGILVTVWINSKKSKKASKGSGKYCPDPRAVR